MSSTMTCLKSGLANICGDLSAVHGVSSYTVAIYAFLYILGFNDPGFSEIVNLVPSKKYIIIEQFLVYNVKRKEIHESCRCYGENGVK
jgi:hypothetical protein